MKIIDINNHKKTKTKICLAVGFFDCVHVGHRQILDNVKHKANENKAKSMVMTFKGGIEFSNQIKGGLPIYSYNDRIGIFASLGIDYCLSLEWSREFAALSPQEFLELLFNNINIVSVHCGFDFRYGNKGKGDVELLDNMCNKHNAELDILSSVLINGKRASTTRAKQLLQSLDLPMAARVLGEPYFIKGKVVSGRGIGKSNQLPTANLNIDRDKLVLPNGVYGTMVQLGDVCYKAVTNIGAKPTYNVKEENIETLLLDFSGDIYNQNITVHFIKYLRPIKTFNSITELINQINQDKLWEFSNRII